MSHRVGFLSEIDQRSYNAAGYVEETHLTEKIAGVQLGDDDFFTVVIFENYGD
jgi:hypothetical protein